MKNFSTLKKSDNSPKEIRKACLLLNPALLQLHLGTVLSSASLLTLILYLSTSILERTGSAFFSTSIFASTWGFSILLTPQICRAAETYRPVKLLLASSVAILGLTSLIIYCADNTLIVLFLFAVIGVLESLNRSASNVCIKCALESCFQERSFAFYGSARPIGALLGSTAFTSLLPENNPAALAIFNLCALLLVIFNYLLLLITQSEINFRKAHEEKRVNLFTYFKNSAELINSSPLIKQGFIYVMISGGIYFGIYHLTRVTYPIEVLSSGKHGVGVIQIIGTAATLLSSLLATTFIKDGSLSIGKLARVNYQTTSLLASIIIPLLTIHFAHIYYGYIVYFLYILLFQTTYGTARARTLSIASQPDIANVTTLMNAASASVMILALVSGSLLVDLLGYSYAINLFAIALFGANIYLITSSEP